MILKSNDIDEVEALIQKHNIDMIVIDHYGIGFEYEKELKERCPNLKILVIDDIYKRHYCDILINHNISGNVKKYKGLVPSHCELRCGADYTLLREEFHLAKASKIVFLALFLSISSFKALSHRILKKLSEELKLWVGLCQVISDFINSHICFSLIPEK